ncbi:flagellar hook capping FlgD N-terminal domain-containing protein [Vibrio owensii]|uniref:flagellar hook capping FlgD N-terminal domain-containing protein n=1 Tax=Vibrio owensii TaxID=696485 RepID=UPI0018F18616|nr:flagellar hook capping FlgD N-terminal domain-containing protein [Vibrio owensii]
MQVNTTSVSQSPAGSTLGRNLTQGQELQSEFITLMVAQIQNQDPMEPTDSAEYINQMAQLSMVESNENLVTLTKTNQIYMDNLQVLGTTQLVGRDVDVRTSKISVDGQSQIDGRIELDASSSEVVLELKDSIGRVVEVNLGPQAAGNVDFALNPKELGLLDGEYSLNVRMKDGQSYQPHKYVNGTVGSVDIDSVTGEMTLTVSGVGQTPIYEIGRFS